MKKIKVDKSTRNWLRDVSTCADVILQGVSAYFIGKGFCTAIFKKPCKGFNWFMAGTIAQWSLDRRNFCVKKYFDNVIDHVFEVVDETE